MKKQKENSDSCQKTSIPLLFQVIIHPLPPKNRTICYLLGSMQIKCTKRKLEGIYRRGF